MAAMPAYAASLNVKDNKLVYGKQEVMLRGVAVGDPFMARAGRPITDYLRIAKQWNANTVRISVQPGTWRAKGRKQVIERLNREIGAAHAAGMFVILAWHTIGFPDGQYHKAEEGLPADAYDSTLALAWDFWRYMSKQYGRNGRVVFELWNEPVFPERPANAAEAWGILKGHFEPMIAMIRAQGAKNVVLVTGSGWGYELGGIRDNLIEDANTAYSWHVYGGSGDDDPDQWSVALDGLYKIKPVVVTEWGFAPDAKGPYRGTAETFGAKFVYFMQKRGLHGTAWCWHPVWTPSMLEADWKTPTAFGGFVQWWLKEMQEFRLIAN